MKANTGDAEAALSDLGYLFDLSARLALGVETEARLLALAGDDEKALQRLAQCVPNRGRSPSGAYCALAREIEAGDGQTSSNLYSAAEGTALAFYLATAPQATQGYGDIPAVYFAMASYLDPESGCCQDVVGRRARPV